MRLYSNIDNRIRKIFKNGGHTMITELITEMAQYLTFTLDSEIFAVNISKVREVLDFTTITKVPRTPGVYAGDNQSSG